MDNYKLRKLPKKKPVICLDNLYLLRYTHWVLDDSIYSDEHQQIQVATGLLMAVFFGCRLCLLFDTRVKIDDSKNDDMSKPIEDITILNDRNASEHDLSDIRVKGHKSNHEDNRPMIINSDNKLGPNSNTLYDSNSDNEFNSDNKLDYNSSTVYDRNSDNDSDSVCNSDGGIDFDSICDSDSDCGTDGDYDAGSDETRTFLYRHFIISIFPNPTPGNRTWFS